MAGYNYNENMSNNAKACIDAELIPENKINNKTLKCISHVLFEKDFVKWLIKKRIWKSVEAHHINMKLVRFFDINDLIKISNLPDDELEKLAISFFN